MRKILNHIKRILYFFSLCILNRIVAYIPCNWFRKTIYRIVGMKIGRKSQIDMGQYMLAPKKIQIGTNSHINQGCLLDGRGGITIGDNVSISHRVQIMTGTHDIQASDFRGYVKPVQICEYVFIGLNVIVLGGEYYWKGRSRVCWCGRYERCARLCGGCRNSRKSYRRAKPRFGLCLQAGQMVYVK